MIRDSVPSDAGVLCVQLRRADQDELAAAGSTPFGSLVSGLGGIECHTALIGGEIIAMFGIAPSPLGDGIAAPWFLGSDALARHPLLMMRESRAFVQRWASQHALFNYVHERNVEACRWLDTMGFKLDREAVAEHPDTGERFIPFSMARQEVTRV